MKLKILRLICLMTLTFLLSGCLYWLRAYQVYQQMSDFDRYFSVTATSDFTLHFKVPVLYSEDFVSLSRLYPSEDTPTSEGRRWRYWFRKLDAKNQLISPAISFYSDLYFNPDRQLIAWSFSPLFLQMAPAQFLEVSLRSIGGATIDKDKRQLKANPELLEKIAAKLPKKSAVLAQLGEPLEIIQESDVEIYVYHFKLETPRIEPGYEDRALNEIKISFDKKTQELIRMRGRFAGLKVSINYRKFLEPEPE